MCKVIMTLVIYAEYSKVLIMVLCYESRTYALNLYCHVYSGTNEYSNNLISTSVDEDLPHLFSSP